MWQRSRAALPRMTWSSETYVEYDCNTTNIQNSKFLYSEIGFNPLESLFPKLIWNRYWKGVGHLIIIIIIDTRVLTWTTAVAAAGDRQVSALAWCLLLLPLLLLLLSRNGSDRWAGRANDTHTGKEKEKMADTRSDKAEIDRRKGTREARSKRLKSLPNRSVRVESILRNWSRNKEEEWWSWSLISLFPLSVPYVKMAVYQLKYCTRRSILERTRLLLSYCL